VGAEMLHGKPSQRGRTASLTPSILASHTNNDSPQELVQMIEHVSVGTHHYPQAVAFYQQVLAPLGLTLRRDTGAEAAFGTGDQWSFFIYPVAADEPVVAKGMHVALAAPSRQAVKQVHALAMAAQALDIFTPRTRPDINDTYFGAMFNDIDGHRIEVLTHLA
jgi:catechol 2,3-dioxygenase-like lactoylglutathione lyase family enzyme